MSDGDFTLAKDGHLAIISLNRPEKRNALTGATLLQLQHMAEALADVGEADKVLDLMTADVPEARIVVE
jgi:enoyl-CoA hydratase/carnithine racemase